MTHSRFPSRAAMLARTIGGALALTLLLMAGTPRVRCQQNGPPPSSDGKKAAPVATAGLYELRLKTLDAGEEGYDIEGAYPVMLSADKSLEADFNRRIHDFLLKLIPDKKAQREAARAARRQSQKGGEIDGDEFELACTIVTANQEMISASFEYNGELAGDAHPLSGTRSFNYSVPARKMLALGDMFRKGSNYVSLISEYCIQDLKRELARQNCSDDGHIREGAGPREENFGDVTFSEKGLTIDFNPPSVAPYSCGLKQVHIPYAVLKDVIEPSSPLARLVNGKAGSHDRD